MTTENTSFTDLKETVLTEARRFLAAIEAGASDEKLTAILHKIKELELRLLREAGTMLDPEVWRILQNRLEKRQDTDFIG
jgi:hypothetical protein